MLNPISSVSSQQGLGKIGDAKVGARFRSGSCAGATAQTYTTAIGGTWATGETVAIAFTPYHPNGTAGDAIEVSATVGATTTTAAVAALLLAAIQSSAAAGYCTASLSSSTITYTGRAAIQFAVATGSTSSTSSGSYTHTAGTAAAVAADIPVGRAVILASSGYQSGTPDIKMPVVADFTAQSWAWAIGSLSASSELQAFGTFAGIPFQARAIYNTSNNQTVADLATNLETVFNASPFTAGKSLVASASSGTLTVAADVAGNVFTMTVTCNTDADVTIALTRTGNPGNPTYDALAKLIGFTASGSGTMPSSMDGGAAVYKGNSTAKVCADGEIVLFSTAPTAGLGIWVGLDTTSPGAVYSAISGSASPLWVPAQITHDGYVSLRALNLP